MAPSKSSVARGPDVVSAGAVVIRSRPASRRKGRREVLLVHRPKYDDWSFPKGKQDLGEHVTTTAVREVVEETGVEIRLGRPLLPQLYTVSGGRAKKVHYWVGHVLGDADVASYPPNDEIDALEWFDLDKAAKRLTYRDDIALLDQVHEEPRTTSALIVLRHAKALKRGSWQGPDQLRGLAQIGAEQSRAVAPLLHAYGVVRVVSSSSTRCVQTVEPYASEHVFPVEELDGLSEEDYAEDAARSLLGELMSVREPSVVCSHRPVLPELFDILGIEEEPLATAEMVVLHHRKGRVVATERHLPVAPPLD